MPALVVAVVAGLVAAPTSSGKGVGATRPPVALSVSPARLALTAPSSRTVRLRNIGAEEVVVDVGRRPLGPRRPAVSWVSIAPERIVLRPGSSAALTLRADPGQRAGPGDHHVVVLFAARPEVATRVAVQVRLGIVVRMRVAGRIRRSVAVQGLRVLRRGGARMLLVSVANRGNVSEDLRGRVAIALKRSGRVVARLPVIAPRELRPGVRAPFRARYSGRARGFVAAEVTVRLRGGARSIRRMFRIRL